MTFNKPLNYHRNTSSINPNTPFHCHAYVYVEAHKYLYVYTFECIQYPHMYKHVCIYVYVYGIQATKGKKRKRDGCHVYWTFRNFRNIIIFKDKSFHIASCGHQNQFIFIFFMVFLVVLVLLSLPHLNWEEGQLFKPQKSHSSKTVWRHFLLHNQ